MGLYKGVRGGGWVHGLLSTGVTRPHRPLPQAGDSPSVSLGKQATQPRGLTALRSVCPGADGAKGWQEQGALADPVASPARSPRAKHLTLQRCPPLCWNAIGSRQLVTVSRAKKSARKSSCAARQSAKVGRVLPGLKEGELVARFGDRDG